MTNRSKFHHDDPLFKLQVLKLRARTAQSVDVHLSVHPDTVLRIIEAVKAASEIPRDKDCNCRLCVALAELEDL